MQPSVAWMQNIFWCKLQVPFTQVLSDDEDVSDEEQQAQVR